MKKTIASTCVFLLFLTMASYSQQRQLSAEQRRQLQDQKADSAVSNRELTRMKELFDLTPRQEQLLYKAGIAVSRNRRAAFRSYWKQEEFIEQMAKVDNKADSIYQSIIGEEKYKLYKEVVRSSVAHKEAVMRQRAITDSLTRKSQQP